MLAREQVLYTSSVTYCDPPESLLVQQFDIIYYNNNQSIFFNVSASSVEENVNVTASLLLNVYGIKPVNITIDLCDILGGALCPLPMYNFVGSDTLSLPSSVDIANNLPGIAFVIPDLEGYAQLSLNEVGTGALKACVQATLSNGWSMNQPSVSWTTAGITIATTAVAAWQSLSPTALLPFRLVDLLHLYQTIAASAFLNLNYPVVYRAYALNFAWALGLVHSTSMQSSIDSMRHRTGGNMANSTSSSAVEFVNRKYSPYNAVVTRGLPSAPGIADYKIFSTVATVTGTSSNVLDAGVPTYVNSVNIASANAFMTVFLCLLIFYAVAIGVFALIYAVLFVLQRLNPSQSDRYVEHRVRYPAFVRAWTLRLVLMTIFPIIVFAFFQWTLKDSWVPVLLSVISVLAICGGLGYAVFVTMREARRSTPYSLYSRPELLSSYGPLYAQYLNPRYFYFLIPLAAIVLRSVFISFGHADGLPQIILLMILELAVLTSILVLRPHKTRGADVFSSFLAIIRLVCTGLLIAFLERLNVSPIPRVAIGIVMAVIFSVTVIVVLINLVLHSGVNRLWSRRKSSDSDSTVHQESSAEDNGMLEKDEQKNRLFSTHSRPGNSTPERSVPLDPEINQPYPPITPTTGNIASTHLGNMPRRWSITPPTSPTDSIDSPTSPTHIDSQPENGHEQHLSH
ncbi:TRP-domain-containing protein [Hymenopellis radicata]|nr:TRP-domain-containing protein [Hymenopellis radicata]